MHTMKNIMLGLGLSLTLAAQAETGYGPCEYGKTTLSSLTCFGPATLNGTTVQGELKVMGPLTMQDAVVNDVNVKGIMHSAGSTINGGATVYGPIFAESTTFNGAVFSATNKLVLTDSKVTGDLTIQSDDKLPVVELSNTSIKGGITFTKQAGEVDLSKNAKVMGAITNGSQKTTGK